MIKVALISTIQPETHYTRYLSSALQKKYSKDLLLSLYVDSDPKNKKRILDLHHIEIVWQKGVLYPIQILKKVIQEKPNVVHLQQEMNMYGRPITAVLFPWLVLFLRLIGKKSIITFHAAPSQHEIDQEFLNTFSYPQNKFTMYAARLAFSYLYRFSGFFCTHIIVHSHYIKKTLVNEYGISEKKITVIPIGSDIVKPLKNNASLGEDIEALMKGKKIILFFGFILKRKGLEYLINAFSELHKKFPEYIVIFAGGTLNYQNFYMLDLQKQIRKLELTHKILFTGFLTEAQIHRLYKEAQFLVLPYTYSISSSLPLTFAIQYHKPVIATDIGSLSEEVRNGKDGILCKPRNVKSLESAMEKIMENNILYNNLCEGMGITHTQRTWEHTADLTFTLYSKVLAS